MGAIEITWGVLVIGFGLIGIVRGFLKELGVTAVLLVMLFAFDHWGGTITRLLFQGAGKVGVSFGGEPDKTMAEAAFYIITTAVVAFVSYHGETLAFQGSPPKGIAGQILALAVGLANGYLVAGTFWFYMHRFDYPFGLFSKELTPLAQELIKILPLAVLCPYLPFLMVFMVIARVIR